MSSDRANLFRLLQQLPKGTEVFVRQGDECGSAVPVILDDDDKLTLYLTTFHQLLADRKVPSLGAELLKPYPGHLREVCPHGRSVMGTCGSCDLPDIMSLSEELKDLPPPEKRDRRSRILAAVTALVHELPLDHVKEAIEANEIEIEEVTEAFALTLHAELGDDLGV